MFNYTGFAPSKLIEGRLEIIPLKGLSDEEVRQWMVDELTRCIERGDEVEGNGGA